MNTQSSQWLFATLLTVAALPVFAQAQSRDPVTELAEARRVFVPVEDLDVIVERDKQGVLLPRAKFDVLLTQAKANAERNAVPAGIPVVLTSADYAAQIVGDQLLLSVSAELTQFEDDWRESRFPLQRLSLEQVLIDDAPALIGRHNDGSVSLFTDTRGKHSLKLQLSTELNALGSDQLATFSLLRAPSGTLTLTLPAGKRLLIGNVQLERPASLDQVADYKIAVGGTGGIQLRITDRAAENAADSLTFASTGYGLHVAPDEATWHALTTLQIFGKPVDRLSFAIPRYLEIADVESTGLESWELTDDPNDTQRTNISLTYGQAFDGARKISFKGVMAVESGTAWTVPPLQIVGVTSHIGQVVIQYPAGVRVQVDESAGLRRTTHEQTQAADMPDSLSQMNISESLRFDVWKSDFFLRLTTQPKEREVQAAVAAVLDVNTTGLELQAALTIETHFASLFELDVHLPAEWQVLTIQRNNQPLKWQTVTLDQPGTNQLRILLDPPLAAETSGQIRLGLRRDVDGWPVEAEPITVNLPELFLPQSSLSEGAFVIRGDDDLDLEAFDLTSLDPLPLKAAFERLRFQSQDTRFSGKLKITRKPSRIAAQTVTFGRMDPQTFHAFIQSVIEVQGGGIRTINVALPESAGTALRFECPSLRIIEQKAAAPQNGERVWTLQFEQRLRGQALVFCDIELPRSESKDFIVPQCRFIDADRQNGYFAVEAGGEQRITIAAMDAGGNALPEVDPLDLPNVFYQPKERIVAVYRTPAPGAVLTLSEQKFEKLPVPTAICALLEISTILGGTGELQHRATFQFSVVGVQGLDVTLPNGSTLWATLVDGHPVEIRRSGDVYLVPLTATNTPSPQTFGGLRTLQLFYRSEVATSSQLGTVRQTPPSLTVESGQRTALPVEVLEQKWDLHYPEETRLIDNHSPLEPRQPLDGTSLLTTWNSDLRIPTLVDLGWQLLAVFVTIGVITLVTHSYRKKQMVLTLFVMTLIVAGIVPLLLPAVQQNREASRRAQLKNEMMQLGLAAQNYSKTSEGLPSHYYTDDNSVVDRYDKTPILDRDEKVNIQKMKTMPAPSKTLAAPEAGELRKLDEFKNNVALKSHTVRNRFMAPETPMAPAPFGSIMPPSAAMMNRPGPMIDGPGPGVMNPSMNGKHGDAMLGQLGAEAPEAADGDIPHSERQLSLNIRQNQEMGETSNARDLGLLSLAIDFVPPAGSRVKNFHYVGADTSTNGIPLVVDYIDRNSGGALRLFVIALIAMIGWFVRSASTSTKMGCATLGLIIPLALLPLAPTGWLPILDGVFVGTLISIGFWLVCSCVIFCTCCGPRLVGLKLPKMTAALAMTFLVSHSTYAQGEKPNAEKSNPNGQQAVELKPSTTLIVPFDAGTEPLASERVLLSHEQFLQLYRLANPDKFSKRPAPQAGGIFEALYVAKLVANENHPDEAMIEVTARFAVKSFVDGQLLVDLPVGQVAAREAKLNGQTAALITNMGCFKVAISKPGLHVIDFAFGIPAKLSGTTGSFTLPLLPVPAGKMAFELPGKDFLVRVNGSSTIFRRVSQNELKSVEFPIDKGGDVTVAWQPQLAQGAATAVVHVDSVEAITLSDAGTAVSHGFSYRVRQGGIADTSLTLPDTLRLQTVNGPDVGGWELLEVGAARKLRVIFRRNVTDQTRLTIETFLDVKVGTDPQVIAVPQIVPQEITNEIGQVAIFAGNQFSIRAEQVELLSQIDGDKFATQIPVSLPNVPPQLAYRFSKRPFTLSLQATRLESQAHVTSQHAAFISFRKQQLTTRFRYNLTGAPRSSLTFALPENFVLLDCQATGLRDYYVSKTDDGTILTIDLKGPRLGLTEVVLTGFTKRNNAKASIEFPQPRDATRLDSEAAVWLEEGFTSTLDSYEGWRQEDATHVSGELRAIRPSQSAQLSFSSNIMTPSVISLNLTQASPELSANSLSMVTATDVAVIYMLALQWQIDVAKTDTLTFTTPDWLAGKLEFQGTGIREATHVNAGNDRTRWTIHLRSPVNGKYFATATATLPPATTEVLAPALVFEHEQKTVELQRQYVLLINSSLGQLSIVDPTLVESVQREDLPVIIGQEFVDQATELVRVKSLLTAPKWSLRTFAQQATAPASVNIADLTTVLSRDGTYRAQALYTIKNRSRQFLALKMPEGTELLSVFVAGLPSRAVTAKLPSLNGASAQLIALPKASAASLSFPVKIVWRGRLSGPLAKSTQLTREEFSVPAPQIISQQEDADHGIPVARTRWTVYLPEDLEAQAARSTTKHNLSLSDGSDSLYGNAVIQEAGELLGFFEQIRENNRRVQTRINLKQIGVAADNLNELSKALQNYNDSSGSADFAKNKAQVIKRLSEVEKLAREESQKTNEYLSKTNNPAVAQGLNFIQTEGLVEGTAIVNDQQKAVFDSNGGTGIFIADDLLSDGNFNFGLGIQNGESVSESRKEGNSKTDQGKDAGQAENGQPKPSNESGNNKANRAKLRMSNGINIDELNTTVTNNNFNRQYRAVTQQPQQDQSGFQLQNNSDLNTINPNSITVNGNDGVGTLWNRESPPDVPQSSNPALGFQNGSFGNPGGIGGGGMGGAAMPGSGIGSGYRNIRDNLGTLNQPPADSLPDPITFSHNYNLQVIPNTPPGMPVGQLAQNNRQSGEQVIAQRRQMENGIPGANAHPTSKQPGGLSLGINLPVSGRKLVFTKAGGDPKLALDIRPRKSIRWAMGLAWTAVWLSVGATILVTLRQPSGIRKLIHHLPIAIALLGVLGFCILPSPLNAASFVLFLISAMVTAWKKPVAGI